MAGLNLVWEIAQLPLYTLWREAQPGYIAFAVAHCTAGDVLIGGASFVLALTLGAESALVNWRYGRIAALTALLAVAYTVFSEWRNITVLRGWAYAESMPTLDLGGFRLGLAPVAQWLVVPPLALLLAFGLGGLRRRRRGSNRRRM